MSKKRRFVNISWRHVAGVGISTRLPEGVVESLEHFVEMVVEHDIQPLEAAMGGEAAIDQLAVEHYLVGELFGQAVEPLALGRCPAMQGVDALHGVSHPLLEGHQCLAQGSTADMADDAGGDLLVSGVAPGALQPGLAVAGAVEQQATSFRVSRVRSPGRLTTTPSATESLSRSRMKSSKLSR